MSFFPILRTKSISQLFRKNRPRDKEVKPYLICTSLNRSFAYKAMTINCMVGATAKGRVDRFLQINLKWNALDYALPHAATTYHKVNITMGYLLAPAPLRTVLALFTHTAPHIVFTGNPNILTIIRGFGSGNRFSISLNFSQLRHLLFPLRFSHLNSNFITACLNRISPR